MKDTGDLAFTFRSFWRLGRIGSISLAISDSISGGFFPPFSLNAMHLNLDDISIHDNSFQSLNEGGTVL
ncbi:hypothetical protein [Holdemanella porci]|uniref:hypothetical protein n=1 Tax=Holdemanella porci TaxID=2652276 RepID=UPI002FDCDC17